MPHPIQDLRNAPNLADIDRRLALSFGALILFLLITALLAGGYYLRGVMEREQDRLSTLTTQVLANAVSRISFSGKYHARLMLEEIKQAQPSILYLRLIDTHGQVFAHSDPSKNDHQADTETLNIANALLAGAEPRHVRQFSIAGHPVREVSLPYRGGYNNILLGVIQVGISENERHAAFKTGLFFMAAVVLGLLLFGILLTVRISTRFGHPIRRVALALEHERTHLRTLVATIPDLVWLKDTNGVFVACNKTFERLVGASEAEIIGKTDYDFQETALADFFREKDREAIKAGKPCVNEEWVTFADNNQLVLLETTKAPMFAKDGHLIGVLGIGHDITARQEAEIQLKIAAAAFESQEATMVTDANGTILRVNRAFAEVTQYSVDEVVGKTPSLFKSGRHDTKFYQLMWERINQAGGWQGEIWDRRKNGEEYPKWLTISAVKNEFGKVTHYVGTHFDITERKKAEARINELAFFDPLTELPNRILLRDRLQQAMTSTARTKSFSALLFIDLDNFKTLNDTHGHEMGDRLLKQVSQRLRACIREEDTVARLGGDEFVVILPGLSLNKEEAAISAEMVSAKILAIFTDAFELQGLSYRCTCSIGATLFHGHLASVDELMKQADLAMYKSKDTGRNAVHFFDPQMEAAVRKRAELEGDLRIAVQSQQFELYYQPQIDDQGHLTGAEALIRWRHPVRGLVSPAEFIPLAEETGLILPIGNWVLETACRQLASWASQIEMSHLTISVNVSAQQFALNDYVEQVTRVLNITKANPRLVKLELTESLLVGNMQSIIEKMIALKSFGVSFSLDDFGTGYSSLSYLKQLPLNQLKIDRSFVLDVLDDPDDAAIAKTIIALANSLDIGVIAEGVETEAQRDFLAAAGCHAYQGYFFSRPLPLAEYEAFALDHK